MTWDSHVRIERFLGLLVQERRERREERRVFAKLRGCSYSHFSR
jgi:hypothetical protein